jgi:hypothetical protein
MKASTSRRCYGLIPRCRSVASSLYLHQDPVTLLGFSLISNKMKFSTIVSALTLAGLAIAAPGTAGKKLPTTKIANIEVVDTPLVRDVIKEVKKFIPLQPYLYNHVMRSWLFGAAAFNNNQTLKKEIDLEAHAVGTLMHDMGWDSMSPRLRPRSNPHIATVPNHPRPLPSETQLSVG